MDKIVITTEKKILSLSASQDNATKGLKYVFTETLEGNTLLNRRARECEMVIQYFRRGASASELTKQTRIKWLTSAKIGILGRNGIV